MWLKFAWFVCIRRHLSLLKPSVKLIRTEIAQHTQLYSNKIYAECVILNSIKKARAREPHQFISVSMPFLRGLDVNIHHRGCTFTPVTQWVILIWDQNQAVNVNAPMRTEIDLNESEILTKALTLTTLQPYNRSLQLTVNSNWTASIPSLDGVNGVKKHKNEVGKIVLINKNWPQNVFEKRTILVNARLSCHSPLLLICRE